MAFRPNVSCTIQTASATPDMYGQRTWGEATTTKVGVVKLSEADEKTSVRADSTASRGRAREIEADARLMFYPNAASMGARVVIAGMTLRVISIHPRFSVVGRHDHDEVDLEKWA